MMGESLKLHKISSGLKTLLCAGVLLVGCGESGSSNLKFNIEKSPINIGGSSIMITSKNNGKVRIDDIVVNGGDCESIIVGEYYNQNEDKARDFFEKHPEYVLLGDKAKVVFEQNRDYATLFEDEGKAFVLPTKENKNLIIANFTLKAEEYNNLTQEAQAIYEYEDARKVLGFGEDYIFSVFKCSLDEIRDFIVKTDKGEVAIKWGGDN